MDEYSRIRQATIGSTSASWAYDSNNMLSQIAATGVQQYDYSFNVNTGNLNSRTNFLKSKTESFGYDPNNLDRLATVTGPVNASVSYTPDNNGNILTKSDAGTYEYNLTPYAVSDIGNHQNISSTPQSINYYSFEKVQDITEGTKTAEFVYNADRQRIRMTLKTSGATTKTRWYFGSSCEREQVGSTVTQYIWIGGDAYTAVAVAKKVGTGSWTVYNIFRDHLGTITHLKTGSTISEYSFDAWGRRRDKDDWTYTLSSEPALFADRGFTAHEYLDDFKLYNMNGRMYDPVVGRFLSPDPFIQAPDFSQNFNRYSYGLNNPLRYNDLSGYTWGIFKPFAKFGKWVWNDALPALDPVVLMQKLNDKTEKLREKMDKLGIPDFSIGGSVNLDGNVHARADVMGQEVFNTANIDRSNATQKVNQAINDARSGGSANVYIEMDGIGHAYIEVNGTVFSYGRYNGSYSPSSGQFGPVGDGVLYKKTGDAATQFINERTGAYPTSVYTYNLDANAAYNHLNYAYNIGTYNTADSRVINTYFLLGNNCTTTVCGALQAGGRRMPIIQTPAGFKEFMDEVNRIRNGWNPGAFVPWEPKY